MARLTKAQEEYFKNSKARNSNGNLMKFYHGSNLEFDEFDVEKGKDRVNIFGQGVYFATSKGDASGYGNKLYTVYLNLENPMYTSTSSRNITREHISNYVNNLTDKELDNLLNNTNTKGFHLKLDFSKQNDIGEFKNNLIEALDKHKADIYLFADLPKLVNTNKRTIELFEMSTGFDGIYTSNSFIAFRPEQIKSIDNKYPTKSPIFTDNSKEYNSLEYKMKRAKEKADQNNRANSKNKEMER